MNLLAEDTRVIFVGQNVIYGGAVAIEETLKDIPNRRKVELPIIEDLQLGLCLGLSLLGFVPVSVFPRIDFLILATNQLVNHLDKIEQMSCGQWKPKVILRTTIGSTSPLYPGPQHCQDHSEGLRSMLTNVDVVKLTKTEDIVPAYQKALESERSTLLVEIGDLYNV